MGVWITAIFAFALWIILWAINLKSFDGFLIAMFFIVLAAAARLLVPYLPGSRRDRDD